MVDIHVAGHIDFDWRGGVTPEGFLDGFDKIPKQIFALCRTESEIAAELNTELSNMLRSPNAVVKVVDISRREVAIIDGAIAVPTRFQLQREASLVELIANSGGISDRASGRIQLFRPSRASCIDFQLDGSDASHSGPTEIAISDLLAGKASANPTIVSGDLVVIQESPPVFLVGAVSTQGRIDLRPELTVSRAIDASGGAMKEAVLNRVLIFRRSGAAGTITVDVERIRKAEVPDVVLMPFDIVDVPFKGRPPRKFPPQIQADVGNDSARAKYPLRIID